MKMHRPRHSTGRKPTGHRRNCCRPGVKFESAAAAFLELLALIQVLRRKCPWDRGQTAETTRPLVINETFELDEALRTRNRSAIIEELGDYIFMGLFLAHVLEEEKGILLVDAIRSVTAKLRLRHPHVFGQKELNTADEVLAHWEQLKQKSGSKGLLSGLPTSLPALRQAQLVQERCHRIGFDWSKPQDVVDKVEEELQELKDALTDSGGCHSVFMGSPARTGDLNHAKEELGDLMFALVNLARHLGIDAEGALKDATRKFRERFEQMEIVFRQRRKKLEQVPLAQMEHVWQHVKRRTRQRIQRSQRRSSQDTS